MRALLLAGLSLFCALFAVGCPSTGGVPLEQYVSESFRAYCAGYARCGIYSSEAGCNEYYAAVLDHDLGRSMEDIYLEPVRAGRVRYDGQAARQCFDAIAKGWSCTLLQGPEECQLVIQGLVGVGGDCMTELECVPEAYCTYAVAGSTTCPGTCKARVAVGGTATNSAECERDLVLIDGKCATPRRAGESCHLLDAPCGAGLVCLEGTCKAYGGLGEACSDSAPCQFFLRCAEGTCSAPGGVGEACSALSSYDCKLDLYCNSADAVCKEPQGEGESCEGSSGCERTLTCSYASKKCVQPAGVGESCEGVSCDSAGYCDETTHTCLARIAKGQACTSFGSCESGSTCSEGTCRTPYECP